MSTKNIRPIKDTVIVIHIEFAVRLLRLYFFIAAQVAQVAQSMLFKWAVQPGQSGQQERSAAYIDHFNSRFYVSLG